MHIFLPDEVKVSLDLEAQLEKMKNMRERHAWLRHFNQQIQMLDPYLELVKATENSTEPALTPGYWHIKRNNPETVDTYFPIEGPDGEFREPDMAFLEEFRTWDMRNPMFLQRRREAKEAFQREKERAREDRITELAERIDHHDNVHVSFMDRNMK